MLLLWLMLPLFGRLPTLPVGDKPAPVDPAHLAGDRA